MQQVIANLDIDQKRSLLANLLNQSRSQMRLSITQERLWQLNQLQPGTPIFNFQTALDFYGDLRPQSLEIAALQVVLRHQVLQTRYGAEKGRPALSLVPPRHVPITQHDLSDLPEQDKQRELESLGMKDVQRSFDLSQPPLLRLTLARLAPQEYRLFLTMHHIVSDFLSLDLFLFEMGVCYSALLKDESVSLPLISADYQNFAELQRTQELRGRNEPHLDYWRRTLAGASSLDWFSDHVRPAQASGKANTEFFRFPLTLMQQIDAFAREQQTTPFIVLLAGFNVLLHGCSGHKDLVVGSPTSGRIQSEYESLIGMFSYPLLMRTKIFPNQDFAALMQQVRRVVLEAAEHADVPLARVANALPQQQGPLVRAMLSYVSRLRTLQFEHLGCHRHSTNRGITDLDFFMTLFPDQDGWHGVLEYSTDLFESNTIQNLIAAYLDILQHAINEPALAVASLAARVQLKPPVQAAVAATFTADPLVEVLEFWARELDLPFVTTFAPYNQLFQQLRDPQSVLFSSDNAINVLLVRPQDWIRDIHVDYCKQEQVMKCATLEFIESVRSAIARMNCLLKIYICPASSPIDSRIAALISRAELKILEDLAGIGALQIIHAQNCVTKYAVGDLHDAHADQSAHIPYKSAFYAALGTSIVRQLRSQISKPCKVLAVDCDNTLWQGLCAEDGPSGVVITEGHRALQNFLLEQAASGVLICLCSKNEPEHVLSVLRENPDIILKEKDISAYRINWEPKSSNLQSLAAELQLGIDSFCFIDDDARECAEMSARCPEVVTLRLPGNPAEIPRFLQHLWILDREHLVEEDRKRVGFYRDNQRRKSALRQSSSLAEFLETLDLSVQVSLARPDQLLRVAQLTQRTNQFNASGLVLSPAALQHAAERDLKVLAVEVSDRFGSYGLTGAITYRKNQEFLSVDGFYLSCRVLGRGVEHRILAELGRIAHALDLSYIRINYRESSRNQPFLHFLDRLPGHAEALSGETFAFVLTAAEATQSRLIVQEDSVITNPGSFQATLCVTSSSRGNSALARLPYDLSTGAQILARLDCANSALRKSKSTVPFSAPQNELESAIASEWGAVLRVDRVGRNDNFFDRGGNSLLLVQLNSNLINKLGVDLCIAEMFQFPTVASLAKHIGGRNSAVEALEASARAARMKSHLQSRTRYLA